jgi:uncharacterized membrane protein
MPPWRRHPQQASRANADPAHQNVQTVARLEHDALLQRSLAERLSDAITRVVGSLTFVLLHLVWFAGWVLVNGSLIPGITPFDPFPFGVLTLLVSTEGVLLAIIILISQNRMVRQADRRAHLDLQVNLLSEQEMTLTLHLLHRIRQHLGVPADERDAAVRQLLEQTDISTMMRQLEQHLPKE